MSAGGGRILVVDDNRVNRLLFGRGLESQGHSIEFAEHGREVDRGKRGIELQTQNVESLDRVTQPRERVTGPTLEPGDANHLVVQLVLHALELGEVDREICCERVQLRAPLALPVRPEQELLVRPGPAARS